MNLLQLLFLSALSTTQTPKTTMHEFLRDIDPPGVNQHIEIRLRTNPHQPIQGRLRSRTENNFYELEMDENQTRFIRILDIQSVTPVHY